MSTTTLPRAWEWKPSAFSNRMISLLLHTPLLHRVMSDKLLLLTFTGRKSGKRYTTPVGYVRTGDTVTILTKWFRPWWRNFLETAPVEFLMTGKTYHGKCKALTDEATTIPAIVEAIKTYPVNAEFYGVRLTSDKNPDMDDVRRIAPKVVVLQISLTE